MSDLLETVLIVWVPLLMFIVILEFVLRKHRRTSRGVQQIVLDRQAKALEAMERTNQLLAEISQKLDKGHSLNV